MFIYTFFSYEGVFLELSIVALTKYFETISYKFTSNNLSDFISIDFFPDCRSSFKAASFSNLKHLTGLPVTFADMGVCKWQITARVHPKCHPHGEDGF